MVPGSVGVVGFFWINVECGAEASEQLWVRYFLDLLGFDFDGTKFIIFICIDVVGFFMLVGLNCELMLWFG